MWFTEIPRFIIVGQNCRPILKIPSQNRYLVYDYEWRKRETMAETYMYRYIGNKTLSNTILAVSNYRFARRRLETCGFRNFDISFWLFLMLQTASSTHSSSSSPPTTRSSSSPVSAIRTTAITSPSIGTNQSSPTNCAPRCCDTGRPLFTDPLTGQTICSCQYDILNYQRLAASGATGLPTLSMYGTPYPEGMAAYFPALGADQAPFYSSAVSVYMYICVPLIFPYFHANIQCIVRYTRAAACKTSRRFACG